MIACSTLKDDRGMLSLIFDLPLFKTSHSHDYCPFDIDFLLFHNIYISGKNTKGSGLFIIVQKHLRIWPSFDF